MIDIKHPNPIRELLSALPADFSSILLTDALRNRIKQAFIDAEVPNVTDLIISEFLDFLASSRIIAISNIPYNGESITTINRLI